MSLGLLPALTASLFASGAEPRDTGFANESEGGGWIPV